MYLSRLAFVTAIYLLHHVASSVPNHLVDEIAINCGSSANATAFDGREWMGDMIASNFISLQERRPKSIGSSAVHHSSFSHLVPYSTARISWSQFSYTFQVTAGQKFIRLHFHPATYPGGFQRSEASFSVKAGPYTLLTNFSASLTADALGVKLFAKEFCVNVEEKQSFTIAFIPSPKSNSDDTYAFINGIEIVSMPSGLYYTPRGDLGAHVVGEDHRFFVDNSTALELVYRLNVGGRTVLSVEDPNMYRVWSEDKNYLLQSGASSPHSTSTTTMINYTNISIYSAPMEVYQTAWSLGSTKQGSEAHNFAWKLPVNLGFRYLVRLHFCELEPTITETGQRKFGVLINNHQMIGTHGDVMEWIGGNGVAAYRDYVALVGGDKMEGERDLILTLLLNSTTQQTDLVLKGIELFKMSNPDNNLASPNPVHEEATSLTRGLSIVWSRNVIATTVVCILTLLNILVHQLNIWESNNGKINISSEEGEEEEEKGPCRRFSLVDIQLATSNFADELVIGIGGFGKVYKGVIDNGTKIVAIKRLNSQSKQGANEFWAEIEILSKFRHTHLVPLIGYCNDCHEMLLVYQYMANGTLADQLYKTSRNGDNKSPLPWERRLRICVDAAHGLSHLHAGGGTRQGIIHRDVKSSNILLDENWVAKISDFGLSKIDNPSLSHTHISTNVKGTFGYLDPDYFLTRRLTKSSDVYAFGVVLFELLCGRPAVNIGLEDEEQHSLALWVQHCIRNGTLDQIIDPSLRGQISKDCFKVFVEIAGKCLHNKASERPNMSELVVSLELALELQGKVTAVSHIDASYAEEEQTGAIGIGIVPGNCTSPPTNLHNHRRFSLAQIRAATNNFRIDKIITSNSFTTVYMGCSDGVKIAVKRFTSPGHVPEFWTAAKIQSQIECCNVLSLVGYCYEVNFGDAEMILVYDLMANGSLYHVLHNRSKRTPLSWKQRLLICIGAARGLNYLHTRTDQSIIHRDMHSGSILLDQNWVPKISNLELSKLDWERSGHDTHVSTRIMGTCGYGDPVYIATGRLSKKTDVFGFGVVLLEVLSGGREGLRIGNRMAPWEWAQDTHQVNKRIDPYLTGKISPNCLEMFVEIAQKCLVLEYKQRPQMIDIVQRLEHALELQQLAHTDENSRKRTFLRLVNLN